MSASKGNVRALVIGIDNYKYVSSLYGAVADALDLAATLKRSGVVDLTVMLNEQATRESMQAAIAGIAERTDPNDLVIITFAGHGSQEPARDPASEPDGLDEFFVLSNFSSKGEGTRERILDDEMFDWIGTIAAKKAQTLFLADSCHGGGMSKGVDARAGKQSFRALKRVDRPELANDSNYYIADDDDELQLDAIASMSSDDATKLYPSLTFIAAVDDTHLAPELTISGEATTRGAASYVTARAFEGLADAEGNRDGVTSRRELLGFVRRHVRMLSNDRQSPVGEPRSADADMIIAAKLTAPEVPKAEKPITVATTVSAQPEPEKTGGATNADLVFDAATGDVIDHAGLVLAYAKDEAALPNITARAEAFGALNQFAQGRALDVLLTPEDRVFANGEKFKAAADGVYGTHLIILNLAGDGEVQFLFPTGNVDSLFEKEKLEVPLKAEAPFGTDALILISTKERRVDLEFELRQLNGKRSPREMVKSIVAHLSPDDRVGLASYSTKP